jgi:hypothetical protein
LDDRDGHWAQVYRSAPVRDFVVLQKQLKAIVMRSERVFTKRTTRVWKRPYEIHCCETWSWLLRKDLGIPCSEPGEIVPVGKETDRQWEQGEDMSLVDFKVLEYRAPKALVIADLGLRETRSKFSLRHLMQRTGLSQKALYAILRGKPCANARLGR